MEKNESAQMPNIRQNFKNRGRGYFYIGIKPQHIHHGFENDDPIAYSNRLSAGNAFTTFEELRSISSETREAFAKMEELGIMDSSITSNNDS